MSHDNHPNKAGIYKLTCVNNGKIYIGKSINIRDRLNDHKNCWKSVRGRYFESAVTKHGWESFAVEILEIWEPFDKLKDNEALLQREAYYIELYDSTNKDKGYNRCKYSTDTTGITATEETKEKMRKRRHSEESKEKMRQAKLGKKHSEETRNKMKKLASEETKEKMRQSHLGRKHTEKSKEKMRLSQSGKKASEESKEKMRQAKLGKPRKPHTEETKEKMRQAKLGKVKGPHSTEHKEKIRQSNLGNKHTEETKEKMRQAARKKSDIK